MTHQLLSIKYLIVVILENYLNPTYSNSLSASIVYLTLIETIVSILLKIKID